MLIICFGWGFWIPAQATILQIEEAPGQLLYQARQTLKDQHGMTWQTVAFKRIRPDGQTSFELRLVGFPGAVEIDRTQPLHLSNSLGKQWTADDTTSRLFRTPTEQPSTVGQYDLQPLLPNLRAELPLKLTVPTIAADPIRLSVPSSLVQEWQTVARYAS